MSTKCKFCGSSRTTRASRNRFSGWCGCTKQRVKQIRLPSGRTSWLIWIKPEAENNVLGQQRPSWFSWCRYSQDPLPVLWMSSCFLVRATTRESWKRCLASRRQTLYIEPISRRALAAVNENAFPELKCVSTTF